MNSFTCPNCSQTINLDDEALERGALISCPACGESFSIFTDEFLGE